MEPPNSKFLLAAYEDTNCDDHELTHRLRKAGEQNPWISQTLRFTHIHNEKQPTDIAFGPGARERLLNLIDP
jgi:hypothetical protein